MITIAITGGIGAGKSTVTDHLISKGYTVIDADKMSREMTSPGGKAIPYILEHFGPDFINEDGSLNRAAMRDLVFQEPKYKAVLEEGTTKVVLEDIEKIKSEKAASGEKALFFDIPLLFETHQEGNYDQVWVVTADYDIRKERIMERDRIEPSIIDLIMDSQSEEEHKVQNADLVFHNNGTIEELETAVDIALASL
jgi:dephospho-CoA kinase